MRCHVYGSLLLIHAQKQKQRSTRLDRKQENGEVSGGQRMTCMCYDASNDTNAILDVM